MYSTRRFFLLAACAMLFSQTSASLRGVAHGAADAVVAEAAVELRELTTGKIYAAHTNKAGEFVAPILAPGRYILTVKAAQYSEYRQDLTLAVGQQLTLRMPLQTLPDGDQKAGGDAVNNIVNTDTGGQLNLSSGAVGMVVDKGQMRDLPLNGRSFEQLALLQPGVTAAYSAGSSFYGARARAISVNGARPEQNSFLLDGTDTMNAFNKTPGSAAGTLLGVEGVLEYQVLTNSYSPEFGRAAGGIVNAATRGGGSQWNGTLFYFHRNAAMDAKNYFNPQGAKIPGFKRNQFGGVFGGPLKKDRSFIFGSVEALTERLGVISSSAVPDLNARQGILAGGNVPVNPVMRPYIDNLFPLPNGRTLTGGAAEYIYSLSQPTSDRFYQARFDHRFSDRDNLFARYTMTQGSVDRVPVNSLPIALLLEKGRNQYIGGEWVRMATPTLFLVNRIGFSRSASAASNVRTLSNIDSLSFLPGAPFGFLTVTGMSSSIGGDARIPREDYLNNYQVSSSALWLHGRHSVKVGFSGARQQFNTYNTLQQGGAVTFANLADFLRGAARSIDFSIPGAYDPARGFRQTLAAGYINDEYRLRGNLTITLGVRYEFATVPKEVNGKISNLRNIPDTSLTVGDPYFNNPSRRNIAPRVGFAWSPGKRAVWVIRGGFGLYHDLLLPRYYFIAATRNPPFSNRVLVNNPRFPFPASDLANWRSINPSVNSMDPDLSNPYMTQFNLAVSRTWKSWEISTAFVGSRGLHLPRQAEVNVAPSAVVNGVKTYFPERGRQNPQWAGIVRVEMDAQSFYNSLQMSVTKRLSRDVRAQFAYTWSKSIDDASGIVSSDFTNSTQYTMDYADRKLDRGLSSFHAGHVFIANASWFLPFGRGTKGIHKGLAGGWQLHNITTVQSGHPFSVLMGFNRSGNLNTASLTFHDRPDVNPAFTGNPITGDPNHYWDMAYISMPPANQRGNLARNSLIGPGLFASDAALVKSILDGERRKLMLRFEMFNITNTPNFAPPTGRTAFTNATGGVAANQGAITSTVTSSRQMQLGMKYTF